MSEDFSVVCSAIDQYKDYFNDIAQNIWKNPELNYEEKFAHDLLSSALEYFGFDVQLHYLLNTAFRGEFSLSSDGPTIAILLEYDALPDIGHACGHNLIAEAGLAAGVAVKTAMQADSSIQGKIVVLGTPAEEGGGGKIKLMNLGALEGVDAAMMAHPRRFTYFDPPTLSILQVRVDFKGREAHASAFPWEGRNALDAAVAAYQNIALLRQQIKSTEKVHGIITRGGRAPNIIPGDTRLELYVRASTKLELEDLLRRVEECMNGAARATGCTCSIQHDMSSCYENLLSNKVMTKMFESHANELGLHATDLSGSAFPAGSTDMGNVSHFLPAIQPFFDIHTDAASHTRDFAEASRSSAAQGPTLLTAKALALTALRLMRHPELLEQAKDQFRRDIQAGL